MSAPCGATTRDVHGNAVCDLDAGHRGGHSGEVMAGIYLSWPAAPPLSPREREIVARFEAAPDPFADDLWCYMHSPKLPCKHGVAWGDFCQACEDWLNGCTCGGGA